jgi:hypothetical protein
MRIAAAMLPALFCLLSCASVPRATSPGDVSSPGSPNLQRHTLGPSQGHYDTLAVAPDGSHAIRVRITRRFPSENANPAQFTVLDAASSAVLATVNVPAIVPPLTPSWAENDTRAARFCNFGKYIMIFGEKGVFYIIDLANSRLQSTFALDLGNQDPARDNINTPLGLGAACAANAPVGVVALARGPYGVGALKIFDLATGRQTGSVPADFAPYGYTSLSVSPAGITAALLSERQPPQQKPDLILFDLIHHKLLKSITTGTGEQQAAFLGESRIAVAGDSLNANAICVFDIHSGALIQTLQAPGESARVSVETSADGRTLLAYTGIEFYQSEALQIQRAGFTLWDTVNGKVLAHSPALYVVKSDARPFDPSLLQSSRPIFDLSQNGRGVLVSWLGSNRPPELYTVQ